MNTKFKILIVISFLSLVLQGQEVITFRKMESETYSLYIQKQWDSLIVKSKIAQKDGYHSYALDFRFGAAYYHKKRYRKALQYFERLDLAQSQDLILMEYRYYAYLFSGRYADAKKLCVDFEQLADKSSFCKDSEFGEIGVESKHYFLQQRFSQSENINSVQQRTKNRNYYAFYFDFQPLKNWKFTLAPMWMKEENEYRNESWEIPDWKESVNQNHLYLSAKYLLGYGKRIWVNDHYILTNTIANPMDTITNQYSEEKKEKHILGLFYEQHLDNFDFTLGANYSPQDTAGIFYPTIGITWYPLGNDHIYTYANLIYQANYKNAKTPFLIKQKLGIKVLKQVWIEPFVMYGENNNYYDDFGYVTYSQPNTMKYYFGMDLKYFMNKKWFLYASFQQFRESQRIKVDDEIKEKYFSPKSVMFGLKYKLCK